MTVAALPIRVGESIVSDWLEVSPERIAAFADATEDRQWIHLDPERAAAESPYGAPIAHGFLTLSLVGHLLREATSIQRKLSLNYGLNRVRFTAPVKAGARIRGRFAAMAIEEKDGATKVTWDVTVECDGAAKPALVAEWITLYYD